MKYMFVLAALFLSACSNYEFKSNLNPSNFKEYFKPSGVTEYSEEELAGVPNRSLGVVSGLSCQIKDSDDVATEVKARTDARLKAVDLGANAIEFGKCVTLTNTPACKVSVTCYADALVVNDRK